MLGRLKAHKRRVDVIQHGPSSSRAQLQKFACHCTPASSRGTVPRVELYRTLDPTAHIPKACQPESAMVLFSLHLHSLAGHIPNQYCNILDPASNTCQNQQCLLLAAQHTAGGSGPHLLLRLLLGFRFGGLGFRGCLG